MKYFILVLLATASTFITFSQNVYLTKSDLAESKELIFYGYDFSHFKLAEAKRLNQPNIDKYVPAWAGYLYTRKNESYLKTKFDKDVIFDLEYTTIIMKNLKGEDLVTITKNIIPPDSIQKIISNYQVKQKEGVGFVIIVECFEKVTEKCSAYFTFFDIATKKIIISSYYESAKPSGWGLTNFWGECLNKTVSGYLNNLYKEEIKTK